MRHLAETRHKIEELHALEGRILQALEGWDSLSDGHCDSCPRLTESDIKGWFQHCGYCIAPN